MKIEYEFKVRSAIDRLRGLIGENNADLIFGTIHQAYDLVEDYLCKNIEGFATRGKLIPLVKGNEEEIEVSYEIWMDGKKLKDTDKYDEQLGELLTVVYNDIGWEAEDED